MPHPQTASLELCRQLYELSNWDNQLNHGNWYYVGITNPELMLIHDDNDEGGLVGNSYSYREEDIIKASYIPAYNLGYILRKLPKLLRYPEELSMTVLGSEVHFFYPNGYGQSNYVGKAPYPNFENALCKLAIELFKQGILKKESS